jgi:ribonuclease III
MSRGLALPEFREAPVLEPITERSGSESPGQLAERLNLPFGDDLRLLTRALTHRSYVNEHPDVPSDNERLEFLGDAVLDFVVGAWVYNHYPEMAEGDLTRMRSALVRTETLADFSRQLNLGPAMRLGRGELQAGGRDRDALLCATFEAMVGALYQCKGLDEARMFVMPLLEPAAEQIVLQMNTIDPKSRLQEWTQSQGLGIPRYVTALAEGPDHAKTFDVEVHVSSKCLGKGSGPSKHVAQECAAQNALDAIEMNGPDLTDN